MTIWQVDFYKGLLKNDQGENLWQLLICEPQNGLIYENQCPQSQVNSDWLVFQLQEAAGGKLPDFLQVFRPQTLNLLTLVGEKLNIPVEATRRTKALKEELQKRAAQYHKDGITYEPLKLEKPPPQSLPENLWGERWRFATLIAGEIVEQFRDRPIPIMDLQESLWPINLGIPSNLPIPGIVIYGGRKSLQLARWLQEQKPVALNYIPTEVDKSGGLILEAGLVERWIIFTFEDPEIAQAAQAYQQRQLAAQGLHFILVQPDDSGMTDTGFWLLRED